MEKLNVGNERYVFEAVIRWISHDSESRKVKIHLNVYILNGIQIGVFILIGGSLK